MCLPYIGWCQNLWLLDDMVYYLLLLLLCHSASAGHGLMCHQLAACGPTHLTLVWCILRVGFIFPMWSLFTWPDCFHGGSAERYRESWSAVIYQTLMQSAKYHCLIELECQISALPLLTVWINFTGRQSVFGLFSPKACVLRKYNI